MTINQLIERCKSVKGFHPHRRAIYRELRNLNIPRVGYRGEYNITMAQAKEILKHLHTHRGRPRKEI
jgi:hypothetical protein